MRKLLCGVLLVVLGACEPPAPPPLPAPNILSIVPAEQSTSYPQLVTVRLDADPQFLVNYGEGSARLLAEPVLWVGEQQVALGTYLGHGQFQGTVPAGLEARRYDIRVSLGDGREASLPEAYTVKTSLPVVGYWIESIGPQVQEQPFSVIIHVAGPDAKSFVGPVTLRLYRGSTVVTTQRTGTFSNSVCQVQLSIAAPGDNYLIAVEDDEGTGATSNAFRVDPRS